MNMIDHALAYAAQGWAVFPLKPKDKTPRTKHGFKNATTDAEQIRAWWTKHPDSNLGIATGAVSSLVVVDIDPRNGGDLHAFWREYQLEGFRLGQVLTGGGGRHFYFRVPAGATVKSRGEVLPGVDIKAEGGYVVAPPSIHPNGGSYEWSL